MGWSAAYNTTSAIDQNRLGSPLVMTHGTDRIAYLTAGAAGMFCGSCLRDNALAVALTGLGCDVTLVPLYTPIRTDEADVSLDRVFFGGINVYLQQKIPLFRLLPRALDRWLDAPWLLRRLAAGRIEVDARELGELTVSMLQGEHGRQRKEVFRLVDWLDRHARPQLVNLSNILIAGCVPHLKARLKVPVLVTLQGDDLFLEQLTAPYKQQALAEIHRLARQIDGFLVFSHYYADFMSGYLQLDRAKFHVVPLGLSLDDFHLPQPALRQRPPTIGYLARICPEKGFHRLVDAFLLLRHRPGLEQVQLRAAGWLGPGDKTFFEKQLERLRGRSGGSLPLRRCRRARGKARIAPLDRCALRADRISRAEGDFCARGLGGRIARRAAGAWRVSRDAFSDRRRAVGQTERRRGARQRAGRTSAGSLGGSEHGRARPQRGRADLFRR